VEKKANLNYMQESITEIYCPLCFLENWSCIYGLWPLERWPQKKTSYL